MQDREGIQSTALLSKSPMRNVVEARAASATFDVQLHHTHWLTAGQGVFKPTMNFVEMMLTRPLVQGNYSRHACAVDYQKLGDVTFIPAETPLYCTWSSGVQRSISCMFEMESLSSWLQLDCTQSSLELMNSLAIGNDYIRLGLRRVAEELLAPGFASANQIEISLMFVAGELWRQLQTKPPAAPAGARQLSARQLRLIRAMLLDTPCQELNVDDLAQACGMGGRQLATAYRNTTGATLRSFVAGARVERAKQQLLDKRMLIKQIAFDCGFQSSAAFIAAFRKATGTTPMEYRERISAPRLH